MPILLLFVTLAVELLGSWTVAYHLALPLGLSPRQAGFVFLGILLPLLAISRGDWARALHCPRRERRFALAVLALGSAMGMLALCVHNYNPDDYGFFHRALVQLRYPDRPFLVEETGLLPQGLPPTSMLHVMTSYELAVAFSAQLVGADPLWCYQNGAGYLSVVLLITGVALLHRQFRLGAGMALLATFASILFMVSDAREARSFGDLLWYGSNGKVLLYGTLLPWSLLLALRFMRRPRVDRFVPLLLAGACAVGLSGSGLFLFPAEIFFVSTAYLLQSRPSWRRFGRAALANTAAAYCLAIVALALTGVIPKPANTDVWMEGWPLDWRRNLALVWSTPALLLRDALLVLVLPLFALRRPGGRLACLLGVALPLFVFNPLCGPLWIRAVAPGAYWRFIYLLPLVWYAGLIVPALFGARSPARAPCTHGRRNSSQRLSGNLSAAKRPLKPDAQARNVCHGVRNANSSLARRASMPQKTEQSFRIAPQQTRLAGTISGRAVAVLGIVAIAFASWSVGAPCCVASKWHFKSPLERRLPRPEAEFARLAIPHLVGRHILGPEHACICIALLSPGSSGFEAVRSTQHFLSNAGRAEEGRLRVVAQQAVTQGKLTGVPAAELSAALRQALERGVNAVILVDTEPVRRLVIPQLASQGRIVWQPSVAGSGYALYLRQAR